MAKAGTKSRFIWILILFILADIIRGEASHLPHEEVNALREIAEQLGKRNWNLSVNSCDEENSPYFLKWNATELPNGSLYKGSVICNCSFPDGTCHVQSMFLQKQDLDGKLPPSLSKLPYIKQIDFTRNYLGGTIPREWASTKLEFMIVTANRLSGPIPSYLGNISTLTNVSIDNNMFSGSIPAELGKLVNLKTLHLDANYLTGKLPLELNNLVNLEDIRLSHNNFTGKLPDFQNWKKLNKLDFQATGFEGPLPSSISVLNNLTDLLISNLNGGASEFPQLEGMIKLKNLMLRSCNISGKLPKYLSQLTKLQTLDLSFNKLEGEIQTDLSGLASLQILYLTNNDLTGKIPEWIKSRGSKSQIDLSYNKFSREPPSCRESLNLFRSFDNNLEHNDCLRDFPCLQDHYSLHINCGGDQVTIGNRTFKADKESTGQAKYVFQQGSWGSSSTGFFYKKDEPLFHYTAKNLSILRMNDSELYTTARRSPLSLTYYGRCLANGNYTVTLHFAEIVFRENNSYQSLGRRMFDVYVQDELRLKDYDIEHEAQGVDKAVTPKIKAAVNDKTLQIRFVYTGKGTTVIPNKGSYGPLISAISMESDNPPQDSSASNRRKNIIIVVAVVTSISWLLFTFIGIAWWKGYIGNRVSKEALRGLDLQTGEFTFQQITTATDNFAAANKIGEGGFGSVYKGILLDGTMIAVKQLSSKSKQGSREFLNEIGMISSLAHPNLVRLHGCCTEHKQLLLVYEFMENNSLAQALFGPANSRLDLDWPTRQKICIGIARGLVYLHEGSILKIVHRDIKANNILLDKDLNPKISDFGLAKLDEEENTHISTRVAGTIGYMAPEYALWGYLTDKADVYSFGVVTLEIVAGKKNIKYHPDENHTCLLDWALNVRKNGNLMELVDPKLGSNYNTEEAMRMIKVALLCINSSPTLRPTMSCIVSMLNGDTSIPNVNINQEDDFSEFQGIRDKYSQAKNGSSSTFLSTIDEISES